MPHFPWDSGAGNESRTRDLNLGKVALYQLSYSRVDSANYRVKPLPRSTGPAVALRLRQRHLKVVRHRHQCEHRRKVD
jgi:hypothetical protein